jgi:hypothetical protein
VVLWILLPLLLLLLLDMFSLFNTTPSLAATIMNHFKMGSNTLSYNISGMGCSAGENTAAPALGMRRGGGGGVENATRARWGRGQRWGRGGWMDG